MVRTTAENANEHLRRTDLAMLAGARDWISPEDHQKQVVASVEQMGLEGPFYRYALKHEDNLDAMVVREFLEKENRRYRITDAGRQQLKSLLSEFGDTMHMAL